ncbi:hypothetical protein E2986_04835, partial [Frieseomelitta varia]
VYICKLKPKIKRSCTNVQVKNGYIRRITDDEVKSLALEIAGTNVTTTYIFCPRAPQKALGIKLPFLIMIIKNMKKYFTFEITILDNKDMHRRFRVSNFESTTRVRPFCTSMPIGLCPGWNQIQFNLADFTRRAYGTNYIETTRIQIHANCRIRRIYFADRLYAENELPEEFKLFKPLQRVKCVQEDDEKEKDFTQEEIEIPNDVPPMMPDIEEPADIPQIWEEPLENNLPFEEQFVPLEEFMPTLNEQEREEQEREEQEREEQEREEQEREEQEREEQEREEQEREEQEREEQEKEEQQREEEQREEEQREAQRREEQQREEQQREEQQGGQEELLEEIEYEDDEIDEQLIREVYRGYDPDDEANGERIHDDEFEYRVP